MRVLFVHQNFPAQYKHLAGALRDRGHHVLAFTAQENRQRTDISTCFYSSPSRLSQQERIGTRAYTAAQLHRGEIAAMAADKLRLEHGYVPDIIIGHPGWGETMFLADVWPTARQLLYAEFFHAYQGLDVGFDPEFDRLGLPLAMRVRARRGPQLLALDSATALVSPTRWQASTYPDYLRARIEIVHDGIDTRALVPGTDAKVRLPGVEHELTTDAEILTFSVRNLEPLRGSHVFMRALPTILRRRPAARAVIVGGDGAGYGVEPPAGKSWRQLLLEEVGDRLDPTRVHFVGRLPYPTLIDLLRISRLHVYLTYPFVLSWSMLEAMSVGGLVLGSDTPPVREVIDHERNGLLVNFFDVDGLAEIACSALAAPQRYAAIRRAARQTVIDGYDLQSRCLPKQIALVEDL